jgi:hypothetical protein
MPLFHPKKEPGYPDNCITVDEAIASIRTMFEDPGFRVERFKIECVTASKGTLKFAFERKDVK